jgi:hypothetical protein
MTTAKRWHALGTRGLAVVVLGFGCTSNPTPDDLRIVVEGSGGSGGAGVGGRMTNRGSGGGGRGGGIQVIDNSQTEAGGACPTGDFSEPPDYGGAPGEGGHAGESCDSQEITHLDSTPDLVYAICGCAVAVTWRPRLACYPAAPRGQTCDDGYPQAKACLSSQWACGATQGAGVIACTGTHDPTTGADACCYVMVGECIMTP